MTSAQTKLYWREWSAAKKAGALADPDRYELHEEALGEHKSSKDFTNDDLDKVLAAFRAISKPTDLNAQIHAQQQPRERLLYGISAAAPLAYIERVMEDRFAHTDLDRLSLDELKQLLMTLKSRARTRARKAPTGRNPSAQGNALGHTDHNRLSPVGATQTDEPF